MHLASSQKLIDALENVSDEFLAIEIRVDFSEFLLIVSVPDQQPTVEAGSQQHCPSVEVD